MRGDDPLMRILHVYKTFLPDSMGGLEQVIGQLARAGSQLGDSIRVVSLAKDHRPRPRSFHGAVHVRFPETFSIASNSVSIGLARRFGDMVAWADVVHYHYPWPFADFLHLAWNVKRPTVMTYHSDIVRQRRLAVLYEPVRRAFFERVNHIVATSPNYMASSDVLRQYRHKSSVIPIGLDESSYPRPDPSTIDRWRSIVGEKFFLFVGVIRYYKGLHILLEAAQGTNLPIVIVGSGPIEAELKAMAASFQLTNVTFLGMQPDQDKMALLSLCRAVVFPSHLRSEAFGVSLLEGAMCGKPLISSEIGTGTSFVNIDGETGCVVRPSSPDDFRQALLRLASDDALCDRMGAAARARYERFFTAEQMYAGYSRLYQDVVVAMAHRRCTSGLSADPVARIR